MSVLVTGCPSIENDTALMLLPVITTYILPFTIAPSSSSLFIRDEENEYLIPPDVEFTAKEANPVDKIRIQAKITASLTRVLVCILARPWQVLNEVAAFILLPSIRAGNPIFPH